MRSAPTGGIPKTRTFGELLIDCEEERTLRAELVGMLFDANLRFPDKLEAARKGSR